MSDKTYATAIGFVQFPVQERDANGQTVRDVTIRVPGTAPEGGKLIRCTLWPEFSKQEVAEGDFLAVDGSVEVREHNGNSYINMNVSKLAVLNSADKAERTVTRKPSKRPSTF